MLRTALPSYISEECMGTNDCRVFRVLLKRHKLAESLEVAEPKCLAKEEENVRPMVNYTKGMYCEIVIPEPNSRSPVRTVHHSNNNSSAVPMRRSQCKSVSTYKIL